MDEETPKPAPNPLPPTKGMKWPGRKQPKTAQEVYLSAQVSENPRVQMMVNQYVKNTVSELGGWRSMTAGQRAMLLTQKINLLVLLTAEAQIQADGSLLDKGGGSTHRLLSTLEKFSGLFRQGQVALGLARARVMPPKDTTLEDVMHEYRRKSEKEKSGLKVVEKQ